MVHTAHGLDLSPRLCEVAVLPQDAGYRNHASTLFRSGTPTAVLRARTVQDVQEAVALGAANPGMPFSARSGGHGISGRSTNNGRLAVAQVNNVVHSDQPDDIGEMLSPFAAVGQVAQHNAQLTPYRAVIDNVYPGPPPGHGGTHSRAAALNDITDDVARGFTDLMASGQAHYFQIRALHTP